MDTTRFKLALMIGAVLVVATTPAVAQQVVVSGVVVEQGQSLPIRGATIHLTGLPTYLTSHDGRFAFSQLRPGRYALSVAALGYRQRTLDLVIARDTALQIELEPNPIRVDSVVVGLTVTIQGRARDALSGVRVRNAQVRTYPQQQIAEAGNGDFTLRKIAAGQPLTLVVEALEYLPVRFDFVPARDTTLNVVMGIDSVAVRLIAQQAQRLEQRVRGFPTRIDALTSEEIRRAVVPSIGELIRRQLPYGAIPHKPPYPQNGCVFFDDIPSTVEELLGTPPELIERVEIFGHRGHMIRVYSKRYLVRMLRKEALPPALYMNIGLSPVCR